MSNVNTSNVNASTILTGRINIVWTYNQSQFVSDYVSNWRWCSDFLFIHYIHKMSCILIEIRTTNQQEIITLYLYSGIDVSISTQDGYLNKDWSIQISCKKLLKSLMFKRNAKKEDVSWNSLSHDTINDTTMLNYTCGKTSGDFSCVLLNTDLSELLLANKYFDTVLTVRNPGVFRNIIHRLGCVSCFFTIYTRHRWCILKTITNENCELVFIVPIHSVNEELFTMTLVCKDVKIKRKSEKEKQLALLAKIANKNTESKSWLTTELTFVARHCIVPVGMFYEKFTFIAHEWTHTNVCARHRLTVKDVRQIYRHFPAQLLYRFVIWNGLDIKWTKKILVANSRTKLEYENKSSILDCLREIYPLYEITICNKISKTMTTAHKDDELCQVHKPKLPLHTVSFACFHNFLTTWENHYSHARIYSILKDQQNNSSFIKYLQSLPTWLTSLIETHKESIAVYTRIHLWKRNICVVPADSNRDHNIVYLQRIWLFMDQFDNDTNGSLLTEQHLENNYTKLVVFIVPGFEYPIFGMYLEESFFITSCGVKRKKIS